MCAGACSVRYKLVVRRSCPLALSVLVLVLPFLIARAVAAPSLSGSGSLPDLPLGLRHAHCPGPAGKGRVAYLFRSRAGGSVYEGTVRSAALHGALRSYEIYLPPGYRDPARQRARYPVLYLLHGAPGEATNWICHGQAAPIAETLIKNGRIAPLIMVMPDGNGGLRRDTEYVNKWNGRANEMDYLTGDVVSYIDRHYRTRADAQHRAVAGISSGGYGAMNVGLHHPERFQSIASLCGYYVALRGLVFGPNDPFGHSRAFRRANSPYDYVALVPGVRRMLLLIADSPNDYPFTRFTQQFDAQLNLLAIPHVFLLRQPEEGVTGHSWEFWRSLFPTVLRMIDEHWSAPMATPPRRPRRTA